MANNDYVNFVVFALSKNFIIFKESIAEHKIADREQNRYFIKMLTLPSLQYMLVQGICSFKKNTINVRVFKWGYLFRVYTSLSILLSTRNRLYIQNFQLTFSRDAIKFTRKKEMYISIYKKSLRVRH